MGTEPHNDPYDLGRFVAAQEAAGTYARARSELEQGRKTSHWMWFVFPQHVELGRSSTARMYGIASLDEARAYLDHPILGPRLIECAAVLSRLEGVSAEGVLGGIDALKLRSSMTLFSVAAPDVEVFRQVLIRYFDGRADPLTVDLLTPDRR